MWPVRAEGVVLTNAKLVEEFQREWVDGLKCQCHVEGIGEFHLPKGCLSWCWDDPERRKK